MDLESLGHIQAIRDVLARYWRGIDRCDAELVRSTYYDGAHDDHGYYKGPVEGFVDTLPHVVWPIFQRTQHFSGHIAVELESPRLARAESYTEAHHIMQGDDGSAKDLAYGLRYIDRFERRDDEWKIAHRVCTWDWQRTDEAIGLPLDTGYFRGRRDRTDPVFEHPARTGTPVSTEDLIAKRACFDALARYARGVDRCDPELVRSTYHPGAYDDHGGYQGDADGFVAWVKGAVMDTFGCTMHKLGNSLIEVEGDRAFGETYAVAHHIQDQPASPTDLVMGVRYLDRFERRGGHWKVAHRVMSFEWERSVEVGSQRFAPGSLRGARDGSDPVLQLSVPARLDSAEQRTADREAIYAQLARYCRGVDRRDDELLRSVYWPDAYDHHGHFEGDLEGFIRFVNEAVHARFRCTMHKLGNALIEIDGDTAHCETYAIGHHVREEADRDIDDLVMGLRYIDRFERRAGEWRIARREVRYEWQRLDRLDQRDPEWTLGRQDRSDPVYCT
ncbi:MAG: nuclear transport factor 2 family protein [Myxococcota bacterium]|nr:nuclear transport factor 2 family protein [Myxococcota bacterium]